MERHDGVFSIANIGYLSALLFNCYPRTGASGKSSLVALLVKQVLAPSGR